MRRSSTPLRTVVDCFRFRNRIGLDVALEALRDGWTQRNFTIDDLWCDATQVAAWPMSCGPASRPSRHDREFRATLDVTAA